MSTPTSPTPWSTETSGGLPLDIHDQNGFLVARVSPLPLAGEEIAKRIVACVNALAGLPQECLDGGWTGAGLSAHAKRMEQRCIDLEAKRNELLAALEPFATIGATRFLGTIFEDQPDSAALLYHSATGERVTLGDFKRAVELVAKAKGGEV